MRNGETGYHTLKTLREGKRSAILALLIIAVLQFCAVCLLGLFGHSLWLLLIVYHKWLVSRTVGPLFS